MLQHKKLTGEKEKLATELQTSLDSGFEAIKRTVSNHATDTSSKLEHFSATNAEMTDNWIHSSMVYNPNLSSHSRPILPLHVQYCPHFTQAHGTVMSNSCTTIQASLEGFTEQNLKQAVTDWKKELAHTSDQVSEFTLAHKDKLDQVKKTVDNYVTKELLQDIPTGKSNLCYSLLLV